MNRNRFPENFSINLGLFFLRVGLGTFMIIGHGWGKFLRMLDGDMSFGDPLGIGSTISFVLAVFAEFFCSGLLILGYKTKWVLIPLIITMAVAYFLVHFSDPFGRQEKSLMYLVSFIAIFFSGPGKISLDYNLRNKDE